MGAAISKLSEYVPSREGLALSLGCSNTTVTVAVSVVAVCVVVYGARAIANNSTVRVKFHRWLRTTLRHWVLDRSMMGAFDKFYVQQLPRMQELNDATLRDILQLNGSCAFATEHAIKSVYASIDEFRRSVPLSNYETYRPYIDRMVQQSETNLLTPDRVVYYATSSGTTGKRKLLPIIKRFLPGMMELISVVQSAVWRSLPADTFARPEQRGFALVSGKKPHLFPRANDGTPIGPLSQAHSVSPLMPGMSLLLSVFGVMPFGLLEAIDNHEVAAFVQLAFALMVPDLFRIEIYFAPSFMHVVKLLQANLEELALCVTLGSFQRSSLVNAQVADVELRRQLSRALAELSLEYGGIEYRIARGAHINAQLDRRNEPALLHRLWPQLVYASTTIGGSFAVYRDELQSYLGPDVPLINSPLYAASEGFFGFSISIKTAEYIFAPKAAFFEFIDEEFVTEDQPPTVLLSELQPGKRYEVVVTTHAGFYRYRMGDVIECTRFLTHADDLVPLPRDHDVPPCPLFNIAYRMGSLLNIAMEKTTEQHIVRALTQAAAVWRSQGLPVEAGEFTSYMNLEESPANYVIFFELKISPESPIYGDQDKVLQMLEEIDTHELERQLTVANESYGAGRLAGKYGPARAIVLLPGTFNRFFDTVLAVGSGTAASQLKIPKLLRAPEHIQFFHGNNAQTAE